MGGIAAHAPMQVHARRAWPDADRALHARNTRYIARRIAHGLLAATAGIAALRVANSRSMSDDSRRYGCEVQPAAQRGPFRQPAPECRPRAAWRAPRPAPHAGPTPSSPGPARAPCSAPCNSRDAHGAGKTRSASRAVTPSASATSSHAPGAVPARHSRASPGVPAMAVASRASQVERRAVSVAMGRVNRLAVGVASRAALPWLLTLVHQHLGSWATIVAIQRMPRCNRPGKASRSGVPAGPRMECQRATCSGRGWASRRGSLDRRPLLTLHGAIGQNWTMTARPGCVLE